MRTNNDKQLKSGVLLVAEPYMPDHQFQRSVVLVCDHHAEGSIGFILNKSVGMQIGDLISDFPSFEAEVFFGGPVQTDTIHYLHTKGDLIEHSVEVLPGLYWGGSYEQLKFCIENELLLSNEVRFFVGYSGWSEGQLADEMTYQSWMLAEGDLNHVFSLQKNDLLWQKVLQEEGGRYSVIAQMPKPNWN